MAKLKVDLELHDFLERVDDAIYSQGRNKKEVAQKCGFNRKNLIERRNLSIFYFTKLCKELKISADYLLFGNE